jgi:hypothetical protein
MRARLHLSLLLAVMAWAGAWAQSTPDSSSPTTPSANDRAPSTSRKTDRNTERRRDAVYPHPSGQDSNPSTTAVPKAAPPPDPSRTVRKSPAARNSQNESYTGANGKKPDASTACSTARPAKDGGVDCGTRGNGATPGKKVTKGK